MFWVNAGGAVLSASVALLLKELRLPGFVRHYDTLWQTAVEKGWSHTEYLSALCEYEISGRYQRRTQKWLREARLQIDKTFTTFDVNSLTDQSKTSIAKLQQDTDWAQRAANVLLIGPSGTGKTHIASALAHRLIEQGAWGANYSPLSHWFNCCNKPGAIWI